MPVQVPSARRAAHLHVSRQMNSGGNRSVQALAVVLGAIFVPPLLTLGYVAYDQFVAPGGAGWAAWRVLPYSVVAGTVIVFFYPSKRMWLRVIASVVYAPISIGVLFIWGVLVACLHGDCI